MKHITIIEDDIGLNNGIALALKREDITFFQLYRLGDFQPSEPTDLIILDINLPDGNGYDVCKFIKEREDVPVIFLTASDAEVNVVMGLEMGADDYVCKPFRINELMARIRTVPITRRPTVIKKARRVWNIMWILVRSFLS